MLFLAQEMVRVATIRGQGLGPLSWFIYIPALIIILGVIIISLLAGLEELRGGGVGSRLTGFLIILFTIALTIFGCGFAYQTCPW